MNWTPDKYEYASTIQGCDMSVYRFHSFQSHFNIYSPIKVKFLNVWTGVHVHDN